MINHHPDPPNSQPDEISIGRRFLILPRDASPRADPVRIPLYLDPGKAFGDGRHPTTQLCLHAVARHVSPGDGVIDLGCGTGILSIAAAKLGVAHVLAVDTEWEAVRVAQENVDANQVADCVQVVQGSLETVHSQGATAPFVVANILAFVIRGFFAQGLTDIVEPNGRLVLSGILRAQTPDFRALLHHHGMTLLAQEQQAGWVCLVAQRP